MKNWVANCAAGLSVLSAIGAVVVTVDYFSSKAPNPNSYVVHAKVVAEAPVYRRMAIGGGYTSQGEGLAGKVGAVARKVTNIGNDHTGYAVSPTSLEWTTQGGILFEPFTAHAQMSTNPMAIVSSVDIADVGDSVSFQPKDGRRLRSIILGTTPKDLTLDFDDGKSCLLVDPLVDPYNFKKE